jgi:hypothetical protein
MQLATGQLDPNLDPFSVAGQFMMRGVMGRIRDAVDPKHMFYEAQKLKIRGARLIEAVERLAGSRPGPKLTVNFRGTERLEGDLRRVGRRLALAISAAGALVAMALTFGNGAPSAVPVVVGVVGGGLTLGLLFDLVRGRR